MVGLRPGRPRHPPRGFRRCGPRRVDTSGGCGIPAVGGGGPGEGEGGRHNVKKKWENHSKGHSVPFFKTESFLAVSPKKCASENLARRGGLRKG